MRHGPGRRYGVDHAIRDVDLYVVQGIGAAAVDERVRAVDTSRAGEG